MVESIGDTVAGRNSYYIRCQKGLSSGMFSWSYQVSILAILKCSDAYVWTTVYLKSPPPPQNGFNNDQIVAKMTVLYFDYGCSSTEITAKSI